jgi:hypothetical protein
LFKRFQKGGRGSKQGTGGVYNLIYRSLFYYCGGYSTIYFLSRDRERETEGGKEE